MNRYKKLIPQPEVAAGQTWLWGQDHKFFIEKMNADGLTVGCTIQVGDKEPDKDCTLEIAYIKRKARLLGE